MSEREAEYLRGLGGTDNNECSELFKQYSTCLEVRQSLRLRSYLMLIVPQGALKSRGIDKLLEEAREDTKENDTTYMDRKKCKAGHNRF